MGNQSLVFLEWFWAQIASFILEFPSQEESNAWTRKCTGRPWDPHLGLHVQAESLWSSCLLLWAELRQSKFGAIHLADWALPSILSALLSLRPQKDVRSDLARGNWATGSTYFIPFWGTFHYWYLCATELKNILVSFRVHPVLCVCSSLSAMLGNIECGCRVNSSNVAFITELNFRSWRKKCETLW